MHEVLVNRLGGLSLPRKSVVRLTDRPDMTLDVYRGRKTTMQQQQQIFILFHRISDLNTSSCAQRNVSIVAHTRLCLSSFQSVSPAQLTFLLRCLILMCVQAGQGPRKGGGSQDRNANGTSGRSQANPLKLCSAYLRLQRENTIGNP